MALRCVVVCLLFAVPAVAVASAQTDAPGPGAGAEPAWPALSIPLPVPGDQVVYERSVVALQEGQQDVKVLERAQVRDRVELRERTAFHDAWGIAHDAHVFIHDLAAEPRPTHYMLERSSGRELGHTAFQGESGSPDDASYSWTTGVTSFSNDPRASPVCGLHHALQGHTGPLPENATLFAADCRRAHWYADGTSAWRLDRVDAGGKVVAYRHTNVGRPAMAWFQEGVPYPVRFMENYVDDHVAVLDLVAYRPGEGQAVAPALHDLPPVQYRAIDRFDPGPMPTAWSIQEALEEAFEETEVRIYRDEHPGAFLRTSWFNEVEHRQATPTGHVETVMHGWYISLDDGSEAIKVDVERTTAQEYVQTPLGLQRLGGPDVSVDVEVQETRSYSGTWDQVAHMLPTPQSALQRWEAMALPSSVAREANHFGHNLYCEPCLVPRGSTTVGHLHGAGWDNSTLLNAGEAGGDWIGSYLFLEESGKVSAVVENVNEVRVQRPAWAAVPPLPTTIDTPLPELVHDLLYDPRPALPQLRTREVDPTPETTDPATVAEPLSRKSTTAGTVGGPVLIAAAVVTGTAVGAVLVWKLLAGALFSRVTQDKALRHPTRARLAELVHAQPGIHLLELVRRSGAPQGTVRHHLAKLVAAGLLEARPSGGTMGYFPPRVPQGAARAAAALRSPTAKKVHEVLRARPHASASEIARAAGIPERTARYHAKRLREAGTL